MTGPGTDDRDVVRAAADRLAKLAERTTAGDWFTTGLLASRPEVVAELPGVGTEHVADARAGTAAWISVLSPAVAPTLVAWLRAAAEADEPAAEAVAFAEVLLDRLDRRRR